MNPIGEFANDGCRVTRHPARDGIEFGAIDPDSKQRPLGSVAPQDDHDSNRREREGVE